jgi:hypothetical protein
MRDATRARLVAWRAEIELELPTLGKRHAEAKAALLAAEVAEAAERERIADLAAAVRQVAAARPLAIGLQRRLAEAAKLAPGAAAAIPRQNVEAAERAIADAEEALEQIDTMLKPPAPVVALALASPAAPAGAEFDPIVMPGRAA